MKIGLDLRMLGGGSGISRYIYDLTQNLLAQDKTNQYVLFFNRLDEETKKAYGRFNHPMVETGIRHYSLKEQLVWPFVLWRHGLDLLHVPHFNAPILYFGRFLVTIHDLTHTKFPGRKLSHLPQRLAYHLVMFNAAKRAAKIIAVSQSTKREIQEHFSVPESRLAVVYEGANEAYRIKDRQEAVGNVANGFKIAKPFILYVGVWRRYKNLPALARVFDHLVEKGFDLDLVLAGEPDPFYPEIKEQVMGIKHRSRVHALGRVTDSQLNDLYNACLVFVLPSLAEGFGLTALEAASCGAPIAASDIPTLREVMGQGAEYFDPTNEENMYDVLAYLANSPKRREELANAALSRSKHFSWPAAGKETIKVYESIR